jgi:phosphatidylinositol dimannoside acyltransferase
VTLRHLFSWKSLFYDLLLPSLRLLGPIRADAALGALGRLALLGPSRRRELAAALDRARAALGAPWDTHALVPALAANAARFQARDYPLDAQPDAAALARFDVQGEDQLRAALREGRGAVLVGSHLGAHVAGLHGLYRKGLPLRLLVQRPRHVSAELDRRFDRADGPHPQPGFFLRRDLSPGQCVERLLRARAALRDGLAVYLNGDIPWTGPNTRPGRLLGQPLRFLSVWTDLALLTRAPVFLIFCTHRSRGRYCLTIEPLGPITDADAALARYLSRLEAEIAAHPADAVAHLLWPCYGPPASSPTRRPSRRAAAAIDPRIA